MYAIVCIIYNLHAPARLQKNYTYVTYNQQECIIIINMWHACMHLYGGLVIMYTKVIVCIPFLKIFACKINYLGSHL